ncbi:MAG: sugar O-acetyltransferase [Cyanobacteria bacterium P01_A01_bin.116]
MPTEKEKMLHQQAYFAFDAELTRERDAAHRQCHRYNASPGCTPQKLEPLLASFGHIGKNAYIEPPFFCDYAYNLHFGDNVYLNYGCVILDGAKVTLGNGVKLGPQVQIYTASHPIEAQLRASGEEYAHEITVGDGVWIGGSSILLPGVSIGANTVIGAGSVVTKSLPANVVAFGNPCRASREIDNS